MLRFLGCDYGELVDNGHCNDEANNADCLYDGGDCCGGCVNTNQCSDCLCKDGGATGADTSCKSLFWLLYYLASKFEQLHLNLESGRISEKQKIAWLLARFSTSMFSYAGNHNFWKV